MPLGPGSIAEHRETYHGKREPSDCRERAARSGKSHERQTYGTMYGMKKTTLYLPDELKRAVSRVAKARACSEADVVREALRALTKQEPARPTLPLFKSGKADLARRVDELLAGFGER